ncbi:MAG: metallophosphoesterase [Rhodobacteraceae bacterium]|nr:metallophosphoesterase [Paracoccaceae bacterium]
MTRFIHLTDLHLSHPDVPDPGLHSDTVAALRQVVAAISAMVPAPDFVVASGDLTNHGDQPSYRLLREMLAPLAMPVVLALGNHDRREGFNAVFGDGPSPAPFFHETTLGGLHVITLDTGVPGHVAGAIDTDQRQFLVRALARQTDCARLLVLHHPPRMDDSELPWASLDSESSGWLAGALGEARAAGARIAGILSGHIHINRVSHWHGVPVFVANGLHSTVDLLERRDLRVVEGTGFGIGTWRASGLSMAFVPVAPERRALLVIEEARLRAFT